jgi:hypothetical protein
MRSVLYQRKVGYQLFPELLVLYSPSEQTSMFRITNEIAGTILECERRCILGHETVQPGRSLPTFGRIVLAPSSGVDSGDGSTEFLENIH